jgi:hypothetical protein
MKNNRDALQQILSHINKETTDKSRSEITHQKRHAGIRPSPNTPNQVSTQS